MSHDGVVAVIHHSSLHLAFSQIKFTNRSFNMWNQKSTVHLLYLKNSHRTSGGVRVNSIKFQNVIKIWFFPFTQFILARFLQIQDFSSNSSTISYTNCQLFWALSRPIKFRSQKCLKLAWVLAWIEEKVSGPWNKYRKLAILHSRCVSFMFHEISRYSKEKIRQ